MLMLIALLPSINNNNQVDAVAVGVRAGFMPARRQAVADGELDTEALHVEARFVRTLPRVAVGLLRNRHVSDGTRAYRHKGQKGQDACHGSSTIGEKGIGCGVRQISSGPSSSGSAKRPSGLRTRTVASRTSLAVPTT